MEKKVYELIDSYREEYIRTLRNWIRTPSVKGRAENGAPFGTDVRKMLDLAIRDAREMGFEGWDTWMWFRKGTDGRSRPLKA